LRRGGFGLGWHCGLSRSLWRGGLGGRGEAVVVVVVDGCDDCFAPVFFAAGADEFVLGEVESLPHGLGQEGECAGGARFYVTASDGDEDAAEGGVEVVGGELVAGEEKSEIVGYFFGGEELGFFLGVVETEVGTGGDAGSAAAAAVVQSETA
jgi:hypothetical protein